MVVSLIANSAMALGNAIEFVNDGQKSQANSINLAVNGDGNILKISQALSVSALVGNNLSVSILGDNNGRPIGSSFSGFASRSGLKAGSVLQAGLGNNIDVAVIGSGNLFAFLQKGNKNSVSASISGFRNQSSVSQFGTNNQVGFSQMGTGNIVNIVQRSW